MPDSLNERLLADARASVDGGSPVFLTYPIRNTDRTVGARLGAEIVRRSGSAGLRAGSIEAQFYGSAGQSFGAFCTRGMRLMLTGEANDGVGKGMDGGEIVIRPPDQATYRWEESVIAGNAVLYGATGGSLYAAGRAGERFAVRNSGAHAVVEGVGDHGCEYMTGGTVVVLGETGRNFGAGMTGGIAFVLDETGTFRRRYNPQLVAVGPLTAEDEAVVREIIRRHADKTSSRKAAAVLDRWDHYGALFARVAPKQPA